MKKQKRPSVVFRQAKDGWRWRIRAKNGRIVAESGEAYRRRGAAETGARIALFVLYEWQCGVGP